ncbi:MAG: tRNA 4-thiouridine(8) synthase ThiI [Clostridia bacterium]|nr:tRNA 4-thiouridine(8) synthase ThiI [Clostridia bacterium]
MKKIILVRYGEIILKGLNRPVFEDKLMANIKKSLYGFGKIDVKRSQARIFIEPHDDDFDFNEAVKKLVKVFGIVSVSIVQKTKTDFEEIKKVALELVKNRVAGFPNATDGSICFKVEAKRGYKQFPMQSPEICAELGGILLDNIPELRVDVHNPDFILYVEVRESSYVYCDIIPSNGGLPIGTNGKAVLLLSGGIDSPVAGWMMAKRGMELEAVHFYSYPYTSERAKDKVIDLAKIMARYCYRIKLHIVPFTELQLEINDKCPEELLTIIMRRVMMKIAERIAAKNGALALITGESLGQVASQTLHALAVTNEVVKMPVFRPLIGMDKNEVIEIARKIETFETSILPYEDCCTVFVAKHPKTRPVLSEVVKSEELLQIEEMLEKAINDTETIIVTE